MRRFHSIAIPILALGLHVQAGQLQDWVREVVQNNPAVGSQQFAADAAQEGAKSLRSLEPPQVGIEFFQAPVAGFPNPFYKQQEVDWSIQQMLPFPGKRNAMARPEELRSQMLLMEKRTRQQRLVRQFKTTYWELWAIEERLRLNAQRLQNLSEIADIAKRQFERGMASQTDVLKAHSELASLRVDSATLSRNRKSMQAMLVSLMGRPSTKALDSIQAPNLQPTPEIQDLESRIDTGRPDVAGMKIASKMSLAMADASRKDLLPDFMVRGMYKQMVGMDRDFWSIMVGVTVPIAPWSSSGPGSAAKQRELESRRDQMEAQAMKNMALAEANAARNDVESSLAAVHAADSILIPQADLVWQSANSAYRNGKGDFLMLLDSYRMSLMARDERIMNAMKALQSMASLEEALGIEALDASPSSTISTTQGGSK